MADPGSEPDSYAKKHPTRAAAAAAKEKFHRYARRLSDTDPEVDLDVWDSPLSQQAPEVPAEMEQAGAANEVVINDPDSVPNTPDIDAQIALDDANGALQEYQRDPSDPTNFQRSVYPPGSRGCRSVARSWTLGVSSRDAAVNAQAGG